MLVPRRVLISILKACYAGITLLVQYVFWMQANFSEFLFSGVFTCYDYRSDTPGSGKLRE